METQATRLKTEVQEAPKEHPFDDSLGIALEGLAPLMFIGLLLTHWRRLRKQLTLDKLAKKATSGD